MKKIILYVVIATLSLVFTSCSSSGKIVPASKDISTKTVIATVVAQKTVLVGEYDEGSKIIDGNISEKIITWEGIQLLLRTEAGETFEYLSNEPFYEGDRVIAVVQDGKVISVKFAP